MYIYFEKSGNSSLTVKERPKVDYNDYEDSFEKLIVAGQNYLKTSNSIHFKNCLFDKTHLKALADQTSCKYLVFSHISIEAKKSGGNYEKYSTASVFGSGDNDFLLKTQNHKGFFSIEIDSTLTYPDPFEPSKNFHWHEDGSLDNIYWLKTMVPRKTDLESWLKQFNPKGIVLLGNGEALARGIYFNISKLNELGFLDAGKAHSRIALFPVAILTNKNEKPHVLPIVTYVLAPVDDQNKILKYSKAGNNTTLFPVSENTWPRNWRR